MKNKPTVHVFAGANGSGKSTISKLILNTLHCDYYNADDIKKTSGFTDIEAAQHAEMLRNKALDEGKDFAFETVLSTDRNLKLLQKAKEKGYFVRVTYIITETPEINKLRVKQRVLKGGHDVPVGKIVSRYYKMLDLIADVVEVSDICNIYDNSDVPIRIFKKHKDMYYYRDTEYWTREKISRITGQSSLEYKDFIN